jgi:hypothetical protein
MNKFYAAVDVTLALVAYSVVVQMAMLWIGR